MGRLGAAFLCLLSLLLAGCRSDPGPQTTAPKPLQQTSDWVLTIVDPSEPMPALLWNGLIGLRVGRLGTSQSPGGRLSMLDIKGFDGVEQQQPKASPIVAALSIDGVGLNPSNIGDYSQSLDLRTGTLTTRFRHGSAELENIIVLDPSRRALGQRWVVTSRRPINLDVDTASPVGSKVGLMHVAPGATWDETGRIVVCRARVGPEQPFQFEKSVQIGSTAAPPSFDQIQNTANGVWRNRWRTDIQIDGPKEDQLAIRSMLFYLWGAVAPGGGSAAPFGMSNTRYNGRVFWDADTWVFPAIVLIDPEAAKSIAMFRWLTRTSKGFPWESGPQGSEMAREEMRRHLHQNGDAARMAWIAQELGIIEPKLAKDIVDTAKKAFADRAQADAIRQVIGPNEYETVDNDLYTNLLAIWTLNGGKWPKQPTLNLPRDDVTFLTHEGDQMRGYQQASAVLAIYPLQYAQAEKEARLMMERFPPKTTPNGPAMTDAVHATIWARLGETDLAYEHWRKSWLDFTRHPFLQFSETRSGKDTYFVTGAAGSLQTVLYGFLGFRIDLDVAPGATWSTKLHGESWLSVKPHLPRAWKKVRFTNFEVLGRRLTYTVTTEGAKITQGDF